MRDETELNYWEAWRVEPEWNALGPVPEAVPDDVIDKLAKEGFNNEEQLKQLNSFKGWKGDDFYASEWLKPPRIGNGTLTINGEAYYMDCMTVEDLRESEGKKTGFDIAWAPWPPGTRKFLDPESPAGGLPMVWDEKYGTKVRTLLKFRNAEGPIYHNLVVAWKRPVGQTQAVPQPELFGIFGSGAAPSQLAPSILNVFPSMAPPGQRPP